MKLTLKLRDDGWYAIGDCLASGICNRGLVANHLLLPQHAWDNLPAEIHLSFFLKNPKKAGFKKLDFVRGYYGYNVGHDSLTIGVRNWIEANIPESVNANHFAIWIKSDYNLFK